jgi:hypothetical protein
MHMQRAIVACWNPSYATRRPEHDACARTLRSSDIGSAQRHRPGSYHLHSCKLLGDRMRENLVIICRDRDAEEFDTFMVDFGEYQVRLSSTAWYLSIKDAPERIQEDILSRLGKYTTHYIFEASGVTYNTVDNNAATVLDVLFAR